MPRTVETTVYQFDELSDEAKERAREWWREHDDFSYEATYDDADEIAARLGISIARKSVPLVSGKTRQEPEIYFSGFWSQGDGACFVGHYGPKPDSVAAVKDHAPQDAELHRIAEELAVIQDRFGWDVWAAVTHNDHYSHSRSTSIEVGREDDKDLPAVDAVAVRDLLRDFMDWIYKQLQAEYEYQNADEQVDENIRANEYEFNEDGTRYRG